VTGGYCTDLHIMVWYGPKNKGISLCIGGVIGGIMMRFGARHVGILGGCILEEEKFRHDMKVTEVTKQKKVDWGFYNNSL